MTLKGLGIEVKYMYKLTELIKGDEKLIKNLPAESLKDKLCGGVAIHAQYGAEFVAEGKKSL